MTINLKGKRVIWVDPERPFAAAGTVLMYDANYNIQILWELQDHRRTEPLKTWIDGADVLVPVPVPAIPLFDWLKSQGGE